MNIWSARRLFLVFLLDKRGTDTRFVVRTLILFSVVLGMEPKPRYRDRYVSRRHMGA